ncbi:MAG: ISAs1 family transposase [Oscillatoriales cyanobacterium]|jgi:DDE_Tnp_1-associated|nr:MAG: ISAs1 family transposase [Oscillatoriales cyanobacterium]
MEYSIKEFFSLIEDPRREQGIRHTLENVLTIVIMAILSGHQGLRGFSRFAESNDSDLTELLNLKYGVPCYSTFRDLLLGLNEQLVVSQFMTWMHQYHADMGDDFIALDGKVVKSTVKGGNTTFQNFVSVVTAFGHQSGMAYGMKSFENGKSGEIAALQDLLEDLGVREKVFTVDALHAKKNF